MKRSSKPQVKLSRNQVEHTVHAPSINYISPDAILAGVPEKIDEDAERKLCREGHLDQLVLHNMREGYYYARALCRGRIGEREVYSAVYKALEHASRNWNIAGIRFFAYAKVYVRGAISREWRDMNVVKNAKHESLDAPAAATTDIPPGTHELEDGEFEPGTYLRKHETTDHQEPEFELIHLREQLETVRPAMKTVLSDHERMVIELCYFAGYNFEQIGKHLGVSRSAVQNAHTRALRKLRGALAKTRELFR